jgi:putative SOS response-associated peptidase YedK
MCGR